MAYKPPTFDTGFTSVYGKARILVGENRIRMLFKESKGKNKFGKTEDIQIKLSDCPEYVQDGDWMVTLNGDKDELQSLRPIQGMYTVKVKKFAAPEGENPTPKIKELTNQEGKKFKINTFSVILEITQGKEKGMEILYNLRYAVSEDVPMYDWVELTRKGKKVRVLGHPNSRSKYLAQLKEFEDVTGVWERGPILYKPEYADNVLPPIENRILEAAKEFNVVIKNGWIDTIYQEMEDDFEEDADEEFGDDLEEGVDDVTNGPQHEGPQHEGPQHPLEDSEFADGADFDEEDSDPEEDEIPWEEGDEESEEDFSQGFE